jgi:hypothetical protein
MAPPEPTETSTPPLRWGRVFAVLLVAGLVLEITAQAFFYRWAGKPYRSLSLYRWSGYGFVRNNPDVTSPGFQINENGFRNLATFTQDKPPRTLRIMILGGSVMYSGLVNAALAEGLERVDSSSTVAQFLEADLRADPALAGLGIEVINAAVNYNRINEVSGAYLGELADWDADFVIYGCSGNNFRYEVPKGEAYGRRWAVTANHPWEPEFQRIANERSPSALAERTVLTLEALAAVGVTRKGLSFALDAAPRLLRTRATSLGILSPPPAPPFVPASFEEWDAYIDEYLGYADAMVAVARRHHQALAFFWEYPLETLGGIKPMGPAEKQLYDAFRLPTYQINAVYDGRARDTVHRYCDENGVTLLDPLDRLRTHDGQVFIDYLHYTREGNRFMGKFMADTLREAIHQRAERVRRGER